MVMLHSIFNTFSVENVIGSSAASSHLSLGASQRYQPTARGEETDKMIDIHSLRISPVIYCSMNFFLAVAGVAPAFSEEPEPSEGVGNPGIFLSD